MPSGADAQKVGVLRENGVLGVTFLKLAESGCPPRVELLEPRVQADRDQHVLRAQQIGRGR